MNKRIKKEDGAIAIITIFFLFTVGIISILALWSIGVATGAYNKLYVANQSAAFSAVTTARQTEGFSQPVFGCSKKYYCVKGDNTFDVAQKVFDETMSSGSSFSINYNPDNPDAGNTNLFSNMPSSQGLEAITVFEMEKSPSLSKEICQENFSGSGERLYDEFNNGEYRVLKGSPETPVCWRVTESGYNFQYQFYSGVVSRAKTRIPSIPTLDCSIDQSIYDFGCITIEVQAAASVSQINQSDYSFYE